MTDEVSGLRVSGLHKTYGSVTALAGCDLELEPGQMLGFLGPNGAGKSTTMRAVMGLITIDAGAVTWNGASIDANLRKRFGYMPQERGLYKRMRILEQVEYFGRLAGLDPTDATDRSRNLLERMGLEERLDDEVQEISVGNQQRVQLAVALVHRPQLLVLDEPFAGLDPIAIDALTEIIVEQTDAGVAVLFSSHQLDLVQELCRTVAIIDQGRTIAHGDVHDIRARSGDRVLRVDWADHDERTHDWVPMSDADRTVDPSGRTTFRLPADTDPTLLMSSASKVGRVTSFGFEPPPLDQVFTELVGRRATPTSSEVSS